MPLLIDFENWVRGINERCGELPANTLVSKRNLLLLLLLRLQFGIGSATAMKTHRHRKLLSKSDAILEALAFMPPLLPPPPDALRSASTDWGAVFTELPSSFCRNDPKCGTSISSCPLLSRVLPKLLVRDEVTELR